MLKILLSRFIFYKNLLSQTSFQWFITESFVNNLTSTQLTQFTSVIDLMMNLKTSKLYYKALLMSFVNKKSSRSNEFSECISAGHIWHRLLDDRPSSDLFITACQFLRSSRSKIRTQAHTRFDMRIYCAYAASYQSRNKNLREDHNSASKCFGILRLICELNEQPTTFLVGGFSESVYISGLLFASSLSSNQLRRW